MKASQMVSGTREWASHSVNCCTGCSHGCVYCYARARAVRFKRMRPEDWTGQRLRADAVRKRYGKMDGTVMFPTTHDITPEILPGCLEVLDKLLTAGNRILIVSKPHVDCISAICGRFGLLSEQILFRFTIGAVSERILSFWEPGAPTLSERLAALKLARDAGYATSVSCEPLLESGRVAELVDMVRPWVSQSIWIGKANHLRTRTAWKLPPDHPEIVRIEAGQTDERIREIYDLLKAEPLVRWKESFKKPLGLELALEPEPICFPSKDIS